MNVEPLRLRESCLIERARACAAGFDRIGQHFSADMTRGFARDIENGVPGALYEHFIGEQEARLAAKMGAGEQ